MSEASAQNIVQQQRYNGSRPPVGSNSQDDRLCSVLPLFNLRRSRGFKSITSRRGYLVLRIMRITEYTMQTTFPRSLSTRESDSGIHCSSLQWICSSINNHRTEGALQAIDSSLAAVKSRSNTIPRLSLSPRCTR